MKQITKTFVNVLRVLTVIAVLIVCSFFILRNEYKLANEEKSLLKSKKESVNLLNPGTHASKQN